MLDLKVRSHNEGAGSYAGSGLIRYDSPGMTFNTAKIQRYCSFVLEEQNFISK